jgi:hypothetical protein
MATFEAQVSGLTGLTDTFSGSTNPKDTELDQFLVDGVIDVTNRILLIRPQDMELFQRESATTATNGLDLNGARIISVIREAGADGDADGSTAWRPCRKVPTFLQSRVVDTDSMYFASIYNPVFIIDADGAINVYPTPDGTNDGFKVFYINHEPMDGSGGTLTHVDSTIKFFPNDKIYLVVLYAAIASLEAKLGEYAIDEEDTDLVQAIQVNLAELNKKYDTAFTLMAPKQTQQPAQGAQR